MLYQVRLELAREAGHPDGDSRIGYDAVLPLNLEGKLDAEAWHRERRRCRVRHFGPDQSERVGRLARRPGGAWYFDYEPGEADDERGFRLDRETFILGEYVSVEDSNGRMHTYRICRVDPV